MGFEPKQPLTRADIQAINDAARSLSLSTEDFAKMGREMKISANNASRFFREGSSGRNLIPFKYVGMTPHEVLMNGGDKENLRLQMGMLLTEGTARTGGTEGPPASTVATTDTFTDAALLALQQRKGGEKQFFMAAAHTGQQLEIVDGKFVLTTAYNELADGEYEKGMFEIDYDDLEEDYYDFDEDEEYEDDTDDL